MLKPVTDRMELARITQEAKRNWYGQAVNVWIQVEPHALLKIPETLAIGEEILAVQVQRRKSRCFGYGEVGYIRRACSKEWKMKRERNWKRKRRGKRKGERARKRRERRREKGENQKRKIKSLK